MAVTRRRKTTVLAAAVATAAALGTGALTLPTASAAPRAAGAPTITLKDGTLDWGVKESFRKYLLSPIAHGKITMGDGATQAEGNGPFTFTGGTGTYDTGSHGTHTAFNGSVRFEGHEGVLDIELSDLQVTTTTTGGGISADVTTVADGKSTTDQDVVIADLSLDGIRPGTGAGGAMVFKDIPATLTADGSKAFQGFYQAGAALDAATLSVTADSGKPSEEPTTGPTVEPTGKPTDEPSGKPSEEPGGKPSEEPSGEPTGKPSDKPSGKPSATPAGSDGVAKGALTWGLKESWRKYIATGGGSEVSGGAKKSGDVFTFPYTSGTADADAEKTDAAFGGGVRFTYKAHGIDMEFSDVKVVTSGTKGTLDARRHDPAGHQGRRRLREARPLLGVLRRQERRPDARPGPRGLHGGGRGGLRQRHDRLALQGRGRPRPRHGEPRPERRRRPPGRGLGVGQRSRHRLRLRLRSGRYGLRRQRLGLRHERRDRLPRLDGRGPAHRPAPRRCRRRRRGRSGRPVRRPPPPRHRAGVSAHPA
ncbi:PT repeat-containing protein [Streptomyces sp. DfronAA-171]|nr:PT repeat-containing protein [Streptomyces sp. DfronAA-171]